MGRKMPTWVGYRSLESSQQMGRKNAHMGRLQKSWTPESKSLHGAGHLLLRKCRNMAKFSVLQVKCSGNWRGNRDTPLMAIIRFKKQT
jgi:hypothetical protein